MKSDRVISLILTIVVLVAGGILLIEWLSKTRAGDLEIRNPKAEKIEGLENNSKGATGRVDSKGKLYKEIGIPSREKGSWLQFRGVDQTNIVTTEKGLFSKRLSEPARIIWKEKTGEGYAGPVVHNGSVYLIDYDQLKKEDSIRCISLKDGVEIWKYNYPVKIKRNHGMSRTVPAVNDKYLVTLGPLGHLTCLNALTGEFVWQKDMVKEYGTKIPEWYAGQCPVIDGELLIVAPAGKEVLITALELKSGKAVWVTQNPSGYKMTHSSISIMNFRGEKQYIYCASAGVAGVSAKDGRLLWTDPTWKINIANVPSPVIVDNEKILFSGGYDSGSKYVRLVKENGQYKLQELFKVKASVFASQQATPIYYKGYFYGVIPDGQLVCVDETGKQLWKSGTDKKFGLGPFIIADPDGVILVVNDMTGTLYQITAGAAKYEELGKQKILTGHEAWAPLVLVNGKLLAKDLTELVCVDLRQ